MSTADIFVTCTGCRDVVRLEHLQQVQSLARDDNDNDIFFEVDRNARWCELWAMIMRPGKRDAPPPRAHKAWLK